MANCSECKKHVGCSCELNGGLCASCAAKKAAEIKKKLNATNTSNTKPS